MGDAYIKKGKNNTNVRIGFKQSIINFPFIWTVFTDLSHYCSSVPRFEVAVLKNKKYGQIVLETRTYPVFNYLYDLFIKNGKKSISNSLFYHITPVSLAY